MWAFLLEPFSVLQTHQARCLLLHGPVPARSTQPIHLCQLQTSLWAPRVGGWVARLRRGCPINKQEFRKGMYRGGGSCWVFLKTDLIFKTQHRAVRHHPVLRRLLVSRETPELTPEHSHQTYKAFQEKANCRLGRQGHFYESDTMCMCVCLCICVCVCVCVCVCPH